MDDNQSNVLADLESLAGNEPSAAETEEHVSEEEAKTEEDEGTADEGEADPSDDDDKDEDEGEDEQPRRKKRSGIERLKRQIEARDAEIASLRSRVPAQQADSGDVDSILRQRLKDPPKESDFSDFLSFDRANTAYETAKLVLRPQIEAEIAAQAAQQQAREAKVFETYAERLEKAEEDHPGLKAAIAKATNVPSSPILEQLIIKSDKGPLIAHYLATHPDKAAEIVRMEPLDAAKEIGRLESRISSAKPNTATKAPPPVKPVKGSASPPDAEKQLDAWLKQKYGR